MTTKQRYEELGIKFDEGMTEEQRLVAIFTKCFSLLGKAQKEVRELEEAMAK